MSFPSPTVFVCGASGSQGGALARQLRSLNWSVHTTVRDITSKAARDLKAVGIDLTLGDWDDHEALATSIAGCDKLFLCLYPDFADFDSERRRAETILRIAKVAGVKQVVVSTSLGVSQLDANIPMVSGSFMEKHLQSKKAMEQAALHATMDSCTILRPGFFMANFLEPKVDRYAEIRDRHSWSTSMTPESKLPLIDHVDIAKAAVAAFLHPKQFNGRVIGLASDLLTVQQTLEALGEAVGQPGMIKPVYMTDEEISKADARVLVNSQHIMRSLPDFVNMVELAQMISLTTFKEFLLREQAGVKHTYH